MPKKLTNEDVLAFIAKNSIETNNGVKANDIYQNFESLGYSQGQVSGILYRLKKANKIIQPQKGYYQALLSENVLQSLKLELQTIYTRYEKTELSSLLDMQQSEMQSYVNTIKGLKDLIGMMD